MDSDPLGISARLGRPSSLLAPGRCHRTIKYVCTFKDIEKLGADLWEAADNLRANSRLTSSDYFMPVLGIIFLRHAANRFQAANEQIAQVKRDGGTNSLRLNGLRRRWRVDQ